MIKMLDTLTEDLNTLKLIGNNDNLTPLLQVQDLPMKGRGYVATQDLAAGTLIHISKPLATVISEEWRPETCLGCFDFSYPKRMKIKALMDQEELQHLVQWWGQQQSVKPKKKKQVSMTRNLLGPMAFCTNQCKQTYLDKMEHEEWYIWLTCMYRLEHYQTTATTAATTSIMGDPEAILDNDQELRMYLDKLWDQASTTYIADELDDSDKTMCQFIVSCLVKHKLAESDFDELWNMQDNELAHFRHFYYKQQSTIPEPIQHAMRLYQHIISAMTNDSSIPVVLGPHDLTHGLFRAIYYREMANSFGLWEQQKNGTANVTDDLELLGFGIYPSAVYFNHSCCANATKIRRGRQMHFYTNQAITRGEEVCISYGDVDAPLDERRQRLLDHYYFVCACTRCRSEEQ
ncbi:hypothetical protein BC941DRAFT_420607 [Chlamydoabsidia padenii]|nr:hypothetical protein BC941DRAFT_420607 [Chlamydoabsidia padenii]